MHLSVGGVEICIDPPKDAIGAETLIDLGAVREGAIDQPRIESLLCVEGSHLLRRHWAVVEVETNHRLHSPAFFFTTGLHEVMALKQTTVKRVTLSGDFMHEVVLVKGSPAALNDLFAELAVFLKRLGLASEAFGVDLTEDVVHSWFR